MRLTLYSTAQAQPTSQSALDLPAPGEKMSVVSAEGIDKVRSPAARVVFALVCVPMSLLAGVLIAPRSLELFQDIRLLFLFFAIVACSAYGGILSGVIGTTLAYLGAVCFRTYWGGLSRGLSTADSYLLAAEGIAVNLIGWALDVARSRARRKDADVRKLQRQILEVGDEERQRIGHDLHDGLGQQLTGISLLSESLAQRAGTGLPPTAADFERVTRLASQAVRQSRELARSLSPLTLEHDGFVAAMEELTETARVLFDVDCQWKYNGGEIDLDPKRSVHLYRITQEAVSNSVKHGKARHVTISAVVNDNELTLIVTDDGSGLSRKTITNPGLGLRTMGYRARIIGAEVTAQRADEKGGTIVSCTCRIRELPKSGAEHRS